jgi:opacity protein-like surface antigen
VDAPLRDLKDDLDRRTGVGVGLQWIHDHGTFHASRTRLEFNVFPEGNPVGAAGVRTYAKDYLLSFDHLFRLGPGRQPYLAAGVGGVHWVLNQSGPGTATDLRTTKLAFTAGLGWQLSEHVNLEARYVFSGIQKTFDANVAQLSLGWRF